jgi:hypothetical protein
MIGSESRANACRRGILSLITLGYPLDPLQYMDVST